MTPAPDSAETAPTCVVVGGGLAGIAAAVRLADGGVKVTLVETRKRLGGRATSFVDPTTGRLLDNCQHVLLRCCTNLIDLYERLGVADRIAWHRRLSFATPGPDGAGPLVDTLEGDDLPAPAHMLASLLAFKGLTAAEKLAIARAMLAIARLGPAGREKLHGITFAQWLADHRQPRGAVEKFWAPIVIGAVNELPERVAAAYALQVFQDGLLGNEDAYIMGLSHVPLVQLYDAAEKVIAATGGRVLLATSAERFVYDSAAHRLTALEIDGSDPTPGALDADAFVSAVPFDRLAKLCAPAMVEADGRLAALDRLEVSPILGIHLWFAPAGVMDLPHLVLTSSPLQWVFNKGLDPEVGGQHLHGVISAAHDLVDAPVDEIIEMAVAEVRRFLPEARFSQLLHARVIKEKRATFSAAPGVENLRPPARAYRGRGGIANLYLAGDWCRTGWPATMEGATRSGYLAAAAALEDLGKPPTTALAPDLPPSLLYRMIAG